VNRHQGRRLIVAGVLVVGAVAGGLLAAVVTARTGLGCPDGDPRSCGPQVVPFLGGAVLGAAVAGLPLLIRKVRSAPAREQRIVVAYCVAFGGVIVAVLAALAALAGAPAIAVACVVTIVASGLLLSGYDLVAAAGLCLLAGCGAWVAREEAVNTLFLTPAMLSWLAAGLMRIGSPPERTDDGWLPSERTPA
jgi:hypothetical protein